MKDKVDLAGIVIHKWVPTHGIYFILKFCSLNLSPGTAAGPPSQAEHQNLAMGPKKVLRLNCISKVLPEYCKL